MDRFQSVSTPNYAIYKKIYALNFTKIALILTNECAIKSAGSLKVSTLSIRGLREALIDFLHF